MKKFVVLALSGLTSAVLAQSPTTDVASLGVLGSKGCQNSDNPPTLSDGTLATADVAFTYDRNAKQLTVVVTNTSPVTAGVQNPLITDVFFNLPAGALTSLSLVSQAGNGGANPNYSLSLDFNTQANPAPNNVGCFGSFGAKLAKGGGGIQGGIANAAADKPAGPPNAHVVGPVTFVIQCAGPGAANLTADAFTRVRSYKSNGVAANVAAKFQGGAQGGSGFIGDFVDCSAAGWVIGEPKIGNTLTIVMEGSPGCYGCFVISLDPGPAIFEGILLPVGYPWLAVNSQGFVAPGTRYEQQYTIPYNPALVGVTVYGAVGLVDAATQSFFSATQQIQIVIQAP